MSVGTCSLSRLLLQRKTKKLYYNHLQKLFDIDYWTPLPESVGLRGKAQSFPFLTSSQKMLIYLVKDHTKRTFAVHEGFSQDLSMFKNTQ